MRIFRQGCRRKKQKILMPWTFVDTNYVSYSYSSLLTNILSAVYESCKIETHGNCKSIILSFATASSSFALKEEIKGDPAQDIVYKGMFIWNVLL